MVGLGIGACLSRRRRTIRDSHRSGRLFVGFLSNSNDRTQKTFPFFNRIFFISTLHVQRETVNLKTRSEKNSTEYGSPSSENNRSTRITKLMIEKFQEN